MLRERMQRCSEGQASAEIKHKPDADRKLRNRLMMMVNPKMICHWLLVLWLVSVEFKAIVNIIGCFFRYRNNCEWQHSSTLSYTLTEGKCSSTTISTLFTLYLTLRHWAYFYITVCRYMSNYRDVTVLSISWYSGNKCLDAVMDKWCF